MLTEWTKRPSTTALASDLLDTESPFDDTADETDAGFDVIGAVLFTAPGTVTVAAVHPPAITPAAKASVPMPRNPCLQARLLQTLPSRQNSGSGSHKCGTITYFIYIYISTGSIAELLDSFERIQTIWYARYQATAAQLAHECEASEVTSIIELLEDGASGSLSLSFLPYGRRTADGRQVLQSLRKHPNALRASGELLE